MKQLLLSIIKFSAYIIYYRYYKWYDKKNKEIKNTMKKR